MVRNSSKVTCYNPEKSRQGTKAMRDSNTAPIIAAIITALATIVVAIINSNTMRGMQNTEIMATQTAEARLTAITFNSTLVTPTVTPFQPLPATPLPGIETQVPVPTGMLQPTQVNIQVEQPSLPNNPPDNQLTFRFYELTIVIFFLAIVVGFIFAVIKVMGNTRHANVIRVVPLALVGVSPLILFWLRYSFLIPSLPWTTVLFSIFLPISVLFWLFVLNVDISTSALTLFLLIPLIAPFITSFGFTFWTIGLATLNALLAIIASAAYLVLSMIASKAFE